MAKSTLIATLPSINRDWRNRHLYGIWNEYSSQLLKEKAKLQDDFVFCTIAASHENYRPILL
uniref:Uncharacterized protein n=1 Tax=Oryza meridionalis TaxID=40149 RepID=A0A0E0CAK5_9ORYZ